MASKIFSRFLYKQVWPQNIFYELWRSHYGLKIFFRHDLKLVWPQKISQSSGEAKMASKIFSRPLSKPVWLQKNFLELQMQPIQSRNFCSICAEASLAPKNVPRTLDKLKRPLKFFRDLFRSQFGPKKFSSNSGVAKMASIIFSQNKFLEPLRS